MAATQEIPIGIGPVTQLPSEWGGASGLGPRKENQDVVALVPKDDPRIGEHGIAIIVCDGVGGEVGGQTAARIASQTALEGYYNGTPIDTASPDTIPSPDDTTARLEAAVRHANQKVKAEALNTPTYAHMASTIVAAVLRGGILHTTHVGDSRAYLFHVDGNIERVTRDHSWVAEQVALGVLTEEEARTSAMRVVVTRSLGSASNNTPDSNKRILQAGDRVMLCSDGLYGTLSDTQMADIMRANPNPGDAAKALVKAALPTTTDNTTAVVLNYGQTPPVARQRNSSLALLVGGLVLAVIGIIVSLLWYRGRGPISEIDGVGALAMTATLSAVLSSSPTPSEIAATVRVNPTAELAPPTEPASNLAPTSTLVPTSVANTATAIGLTAQRATLTATVLPRGTISPTNTSQTPVRGTATKPNPTSQPTLATATLLPNSSESTPTVIATPSPTPNSDNFIIKSAATATPALATATVVPTPSRPPIRTPLRPPAVPSPTSQNGGPLHVQ